MEEESAYRLSISVSEGIVEIVIAGELTKNALDRLHDEVIKSIREENGKSEENCVF